MAAEKFEIEKGLPIPAYIRGNGLKGSKYPFAKMEIGDSFFVPVKGIMGNPVTRKQLAQLQRSLCQTARKYRQHGHPEFKVSTRTINTDKEKGVRIWRVENAEI